MRLHNIEKYVNKMIQFMCIFKCVVKQIIQITTGHRSNIKFFFKNK